MHTKHRLLPLTLDRGWMWIVVLVMELRKRVACLVVALEVAVSTEVRMDMRRKCMYMWTTSNPADNKLCNLLCCVTNQAARCWLITEAKGVNLVKFTVNKVTVGKVFCKYFNFILSGIVSQISYQFVYYPYERQLVHYSPQFQQP